MPAWNPPSIWSRMTVGRKMLLIPLFFISAQVAIMTYTIVMVQGLKFDAVMTDLIARQRALNQFHLKQVLLNSQELGNYDLEINRSIFRNTLKSLINGGEVLRRLGSEETRTIPAIKNAAVTNNLNEQRRLAEHMFQLADKFLTLNRSDPSYLAVLQELLVTHDQLHDLVNDGLALYTTASADKANTLIFWKIVICVIAAICGLTFSWYVARGISRPLTEVVHRAEIISEGDLRSEKLPNTSGDEIGNLANKFNVMTDGLRDLAGQIRSVTENVNAAASQISSSSKQQVGSTREQAATIQEINSTIREVSETGNQIIEKAKQIAAQAEAVSQKSNAGLDSVRQTNATMDSIREQVEEVAQNIVALSEKTQAIAEIVNTVNEVAEQSNLLALNATIEAADAGEQGNRFAVVASEMKNLADQAKQCTVQVRTILGDIQKGINSSVMLTEEAVKRVESGRKRAEVSEETILQMTRSMQESVEAFQQIIAATNQQQVGVTQVAQGMQDIDQAATQTAAGTSQLERAVASLGSMSEQLRSAVGRYKL